VRVTDIKPAPEGSARALSLLSAFLGHAQPPAQVKIRPAGVEHEFISVTPQYVSVDDGKAEPEDEAPTENYLNQHLDMLFTTGSPDHQPSPKLSFENPQFDAVDCGTAAHIDCEKGKHVQVIQMRPTGAHPDIWVYYTPTDANPAQVEIYWPTFTPDHLYRLRVTLKYRGPYADQISPYTAEYWSAYIPVADGSPQHIQDVLTTVAQFAEVDPALLQEPAFESSNLEFTVKNTRYRRANMLRMAAARFAGDGGGIQPDKLEILVRAARVLAGASAN
jgi:hypothetical protein